MKNLCTFAKAFLIYTLAQSGINKIDFSTKPNELLVYELGSDLENKKPTIQQSQNKIHH